MSKKLAFICLAFLVGCATGKMGHVAKQLEKGAVTKQTPIYVMPISTENLQVTGDKANEPAKVQEEKTIIQDRMHRMIVSELKEKGYQAHITDKPAKDGVIVTGTARLFEHGSAAARAFVGMGAGSSNLFTDFKIIDAKTKKELSEFEIIATSGGRGGWSSMGSFLDAHLKDGSAKFAEYVTGETK